MRRLLWRLFFSYFILIILCGLAGGFYAWRTLRTVFIEQTEHYLLLAARATAADLVRPIGATSRADLENVCQRVAQRNECRVSLISTAGDVLGESQRDPETMFNHADRPEVRQVLDGPPDAVGQAVRYSQTVGEEMVYVAVGLAQDGKTVGVVRAAAPLTRLNQELAGTYVRLGLATLLVIALGGLAALWVSRIVSKPMEQIRDGAKRFAAGDLGHRLYVWQSQEGAALADALNQMAGQLQEKIRTITDQKGQQEAILSSMAEGVLAVDLAGRIFNINEAAAALFAIDVPGAMRRPLNEVIRNAPLERMIRDVLAGGGVSESELSVRLAAEREEDAGTPGHRDTEKRQENLPASIPASPRPGVPASSSARLEHVVRVRASSLLDSSGQRIGALTVFNDITRLRRLERVRQDFVANVSHELKTPITSIKGFVETLRDGAIDEPQRAGRFLEIIASQADRLGAIIEDLLNLSRLEQESESAELRLEVAPLAPVIEEAVTVCHLAAENKKIDIRVECPADLTARINGPLLEQAVSNLLDNAIKYSEPGQAVQVQARATADGADILVADRGSGIPAEHLPRLFERFYRVDKARSRQLGGTGLGLAIVKHISNALGGSVSVTSKPGSGSTFSIHLKR